MSFLCRRCYINSHELNKKAIKQLTSSADKFKCDKCGEYKAIVLEPRKREVWEDEF